MHAHAHLNTTNRLARRMSWLCVHAGSSSDEAEASVSRHLVELIALILLPLGVAMCWWVTWPGGHGGGRRGRGRGGALHPALCHAIRMHCSHVMHTVSVDVLRCWVHV